MTPVWNLRKLFQDQLPVHHYSSVLTLKSSTIIGGLGICKKFSEDDGGQLNNPHHVDMCENLNMEIYSIAAKNPWQNSACEWNHAVVDRCVAKCLVWLLMPKLAFTCGMGFLHTN